MRTRVNEFALDEAEHALDLLRAGQIEGAARHRSAAVSWLSYGARPASL